MGKFGAKLSNQDYYGLLMAFPGQEGGNKGPRINIARIYNQQYNNVLGTMYREVDVTATNEKDGPQDNMGFIGLAHWYRDTKQLIPCTEKEFLKRFYQDNKLRMDLLMVSHPITMANSQKILSARMKKHAGAAAASNRGQ